MIFVSWVFFTFVFLASLSVVFSSMHSLYTGQHVTVPYRTGVGEILASMFCVQYDKHVMRYYELENKVCPYSGDNCRTLTLAPFRNKKKVSFLCTSADQSVPFFFLVCKRHTLDGCDRVHAIESASPRASCQCNDRKHAYILSHRTTPVSTAVAAAPIADLTTMFVMPTWMDICN